MCKFQFCKILNPCNFLILEMFDITKRKEYSSKEYMSYKNISQQQKHIAVQMCKETFDEGLIQFCSGIQ